MTAQEIQQSFQLALQHHMAGRLSNAEQLYRRILREQPQHADALHFLGTAAHQRGDDATAVESIRKALTINPNLPTAWNNLGTALRGIGDINGAIEAYQRAVTIKPDFAQAFNNWGMALKSIGRIEEAIAAFRRAVTLKPDFAQAHNNFGNALRERGELTQAIDAYRQAIALSPDFAESHNNLGNALWEQKQVPQAIAAFRRAIALKPDFAEAHNNLAIALRDDGQLEASISAFVKAISLQANFPEAQHNLAMALRDAGRLKEAITAYRQAIQDKPGWAAPWLNLGHLYGEQGQYEEARAAYEKAVRCDPQSSVAWSGLAVALAELQLFEQAEEALNRAASIDPDGALIHVTRGTVRLRSGRGSEAVDSLRQAAALSPDSTSVLADLGEALRQVGRFDEAAECFRRIRERQPTASRSYRLMTTLGLSADEREIAKLSALFHDSRTSIGERALLGFALGKLLDDADRFDEAFAAYAEANGLASQMREAAGARYRPEAFAQQIDKTISSFSTAVFQSTRDWGEQSEVPVFIVGMPRSGTSLVEQIAASHPDVVGAGELRDIAGIYASLPPSRWEQDAIGKAAATQLEKLQRFGGGAARVIDKMPENIQLLGLIALLFPRARVIICRRDARDTCLSCFFQYFSNGNLFSFHLRQCGSHYVQTDRLLAHWRAALPLKMLEVRYESLVADLEGQSRRIMDFLGVPWHAACLNFHQTQRTVQTASDWQVRQPIYTRSVGRWRKYERHLGPLFEALKT